MAKFEAPYMRQLGRSFQDRGCLEVYSVDLLSSVLCLLGVALTFWMSGLVVLVRSSRLVSVWYDRMMALIVYS